MRWVEPAAASRREAGSQTLEFALVVPGVVVTLLVLVELALVGVELVGVQGLAREAARAAAVGEDVAAAARAAAGDRRTEVVLEPEGAEPGEAVTVRIRLRSRVSDRVGVDVWLPGQATMRRESGP